MKFTCDTISIISLKVSKNVIFKSNRAQIKKLVWCGRGGGVSTQFVIFTICRHLVNGKKSIFHSFYFEKEVVNKHPLVL